MRIASSDGMINPKFVLILLLCVGLFFIFSKMLFTEGAFHSIVILAGLVVFALTLIKTEWALMVVIFATLFSPEIEVGRVAGRVVTIRIEDVLMVILVFTWLAKVAINKEIGFLKVTPLNRAIKVFAVICVIATLIGILRGDVFPPKGIFFVLKYIEYFVLFFLVVNNIHQEKQAQLLLSSFFAVCLMICLYSMTQLGKVERLSAPFEGAAGEPNTFGGYLLFLFSLCFGLFLYLENGRKRWFFGGLGALTLFTLFMTLSRGSYFGLVGAYLVFFALARPKRMLLLGAGVCVGLMLIVVPGAIQKRILYTFSLTSPEITEYTVTIRGVALDPSSSARIQSWKYAVKDWFKHPLLGHGVSGRGLVDNQYFTFFVETGLVGILAFLYLLWRIWILGYGAYRAQTQPYYQGLFVGFLAGFIGLLFHAVTANTFILIRIMEPFWFLTGIIVNLPEIQQTSSEAA